MNKRFEFIPGDTVPLSCIGKTGREVEVTAIVKAIANIAKQQSDPSPIHLARAIAETVLLDILSEFQWRIHLRALFIAEVYGDWCGGWVDPEKIARECLYVEVLQIKK
jgi:hypothetical protein